MKYVMMIVAVSLLSFNVMAGQKGIEFMAGGWKKAVAEAGDSKRLIFVDVYTDWCGPCKKMSQEVFSDSEVGNFFNTWFINVKVDAEDEGEGSEFADNYGINSYPTLLVFDNKGYELGRVIGGLDKSDFLAMGNWHAGEQDIESTRKNWQVSPDDASLSAKYLDLLKISLRQVGLPENKKPALREEYQSVIEKTFFLWSDTKKFSDNAYHFLESYLRTIGPDTKVAEFLFDNYKGYDTTVSKEQLYMLMASVNDVGALSVAGNSDRFRKYISTKLLDAYKYRESTKPPRGGLKLMALLARGETISQGLLAVKGYLENYNIVAWRPNWWLLPLNALYSSSMGSAKDFQVGAEMAGTLYAREQNLASALIYSRLLSKSGEARQAVLILNREIARTEQSVEVSKQPKVLTWAKRFLAEIQGEQ